MVTAGAAMVAAGRLATWGSAVAGAGARITLTGGTADGPDGAAAAAGATGNSVGAADTTAGAANKTGTAAGELSAGELRPAGWTSGGDVATAGSGVGMAGVGMAGIGMAGIGMAGVGTVGREVGGVADQWGAPAAAAGRGSAEVRRLGTPWARAGASDAGPTDAVGPLAVREAGAFPVSDDEALALPASAWATATPRPVDTAAPRPSATARAPILPTQVPGATGAGRMGRKAVVPFGFIIGIQSGDLDLC